MPELSGETLDRLLAGELPAEEQRRLAQAALDDPELFDVLTAAGVVTTARPALRARARTWHLVTIGTLAAAAAIVLIVVYTSRSTNSQATGVTASVPPPASVRAPAVTTLVEPPVLLTANVGAPPNATFRTEGSVRREPRMSGRITSVSDDLVEIDLGSVDGLTQGAQVSVHGATGARTGRMTITSVFRDRARVRVTGSRTVEAGDRVEIDPELHATALLEQVHAYRSTGDATAARTTAEQAAVRAQSSAVPPALRAEILNELGTLQIDQRNYAAARQTLETAQSLATAATKVRVTNNLGALAALGGDRTTADNYYRLARSLAGDSNALAAERKAIDKNIDTLARSR